MKPLQSKKYKALILDIDGTIIKNSAMEVLPTKRVKDAIEKADKLIHVGLATSRPLAYASYIIDHLKLTSPCIVTGGAVIYDPVKKKVVFTREILANDVKKIFKIIDHYQLKILDDGRGKKGALDELDIKNPTQLWIEVPDQSIVDELYRKLSNIPLVSVHKLISRFDGKYEILINHTQATKQHGINKVAQLLGIKTSEIIGIGDGYNDFPLLMACGLKVAMGNAVDDLKEIADYVAPSVENDGVADVIDKFILN